MTFGTPTSVQELRRIADALDQLRDHTVQDVNLRTDCRQLRLKLDDGRIVLLSAVKDEDGTARFDVDVVRVPDTHGRTQLEVRFEAQG